MPLATLFEDSVWQMSLGERAAVEGVLGTLRPRLAIEIGTAEGAALRRIAAHAEEVHAFDLFPPSLPVPENAVLHTGNSHELLPALLRELAEAGRSADFALVDGDHSAGGVRRDLEDLLDSPGFARGAILVHDIANEEVRRGVDAVRFEGYPKVTHVELDWVPGQMFAQAELRHELWFGLGLVLVDTAAFAYGAGAYEERYYPNAPLLVEARDRVLEREAAMPVPSPANQRSILGLQRQLEHERALRTALLAEPSWRLTAPLRRLRGRVKRFAAG